MNILKNQHLRSEAIQKPIALIKNCEHPRDDELTFINIENIKKAFKAFKNGKAPGEDSDMPAKQ